MDELGFSGLADMLNATIVTGLDNALALHNWTSVSSF